MQKLDKATAFTTLWIARLALTVLAFAGVMSFLGRVDTVIAYGVAVLLVGLLVKETL